jgi:predicted nucleic-acid-binding protein
MDYHPELSPKARRLIDENTVETPIEVLCEVVFVLLKTYGVARRDIADTLLDFFRNTNCTLPHKESIIRGIEYFGEKPLDFVDCILAGYHEVENITIHTFDAKLDKLLATIQTKKSEG